MRVTLTNGSKTTFEKPLVRGDSVFEQDPKNVASPIALEDIRQVEERTFAPVKTGLWTLGILAVTTLVGLFIVVSIALSDMT